MKIFHKLRAFFLLKEKEERKGDGCTVRYDICNFRTQRFYGYFYAIPLLDRMIMLSKKPFLEAEAKPQHDNMIYFLLKY